MKLLSRPNIISGTVNFFDGDNKSLLELNQKRMPDDWIWRTRTVSYNLNSQGYRAVEFDNVDWKNSIIIFGCSFVFGIGIDDDDTCSNQLSKLTDCPVINLGMAGGSPMSAWINSTILRQANVSPKAVIYLWPDSNRTSELLKNKKIQHCGPWTNISIGLKWAVHETQGIEYLRYLIWNTSSLWNCPVVHYTLSKKLTEEIPELKNSLFSRGKIKEDNARDWNGKNAHPGPETAKLWASLIFQDIKKFL
jgi:hypothetical protein